jgi:hypothetical protein
MEQQTRTAVQARQGQREEARRLDEAGQGDRRENGEQGARAFGRSENELAKLDA